MFLTPANGPFAQRREITWKEAAQAPLCLLTPDMQNRRIIDGIFRSVGAKPEPAVETNSIFNLVSHVSRRPVVGDRAAPAAAASSASREGTRAIELVEPSARRTIGLVMSDREPPSPLARNLFAMQWPADIGGPDRSAAAGRAKLSSIEIPINLPNVQFEGTSGVSASLPAVGRTAMAARAAFDDGRLRARADRRAGGRRRERRCRSCTISRINSAISTRRPIALMAEALNISKAEALGVVSFYHDFRRSAGRRARAEALPRRILPGDGLRGPGRASRDAGTASAVDDAEAGAALHVETVYCLGNCALSPAALLDGEPIGRLDRDRHRRDRRRRQGADAGERARLRPSRFVAPCRSARTRVAAALARGGARARRRTRRSCAPARAACSGWSRWSKSRRRRAASAMGRSRPRTSRSLFDAGFLTGGAPSQGARPGRGHSLSRPTSSASFSPAAASSTRCRSTTTGATAGSTGLSRALSHRAGGDRRGGRGLGPARARRRRLPDRDQMAHRRRRRRPTRNMSSATPTRATAAPSPTAC